ncbi:hypothetical protein [Micromonospora zamorensis]|uniref:hypothetical protein n=1 Tax=Micromonospora zamorensis TaxID=709883 RepID=UPI003CF6D82E
MFIIPAALRGPATESAPVVDHAAGRARRPLDHLDVLAVLAAGMDPSPAELDAAGVNRVDHVPTPADVAAALTAVNAVRLGPGRWLGTLSSGRQVLISAPRSVRRG